MAIKNVVFDFGSVLVWPPSYEGHSRIADAAGIPIPVFLERYYPERSAYDRDTIGILDYWRRVTRGYPVADDNQLLLRLAAMDVEGWSEPNQAVMDWLPILKDSGYTLGILSNMPESFSTALEERDEWLDIFHHRIFSGRVKLNKPERAIYDLLLETLSSDSHHCLPEEVLFLDDLEINIFAAREKGINAELYNVFDGGLAEIAEQYNLPIPQEPPPPESRLRDTIFAPHVYLKD